MGALILAAASTSELKMIINVMVCARSCLGWSSLSLLPFYDCVLAHMLGLELSLLPFTIVCSLAWAGALSLWIFESTLCFLLIDAKFDWGG